MYIEVKLKVTKTWLIIYTTLVYHCTQACFSIVLIYYTTLGSPSWFLPLVNQKAFEGFLLELVFSNFGLPAWFFLKCIMNVFCCLSPRVSLSMLGGKE